MVLKYIVENNDLTINQVLKNKLNISSRLYSKLIRLHLVTCNGIICDTRNTVHIGDTLEINLDYEEDNSNIISTKMDLNIIYEDECFIVLNKPPHVAIHPSSYHFNDTISNGLKFYYDKINLHKKIRPINRLDIDTSGLVIFAKNEYIQECLINQMKNQVFKKEYLAIIIGYLGIKKGTISKPIARKENSIIERCINTSGKTAITHYEVISENNNLSLVKCLLETGRTHQIRVHFASIGHPLLGDTLYGNGSNMCDSQCLLCYKLSFIHPITKNKIEFILSEDELLKTEALRNIF